MASLGFLIDNLCANFTVASMNDLVKTQLAQGPSTINDIARTISGKDGSLDTGSAQKLAEAAVEALAQSGEVTIQDGSIVGTR